MTTDEIKSDVHLKYFTKKQLVEANQASIAAQRECFILGTLLDSLDDEALLPAMSAIPSEDTVKVSVALNEFGDEENITLSTSEWEALDCLNLKR